MIIPKKHRRYSNKDHSIPREIDWKLTREESFDIEIYGTLLTLLEQGRIQPLSPDEHHFCRVIRYEVKPKTRLEYTWLKYRKFRDEGITCNRCMGRGYYGDTETGDRVTCEDCKGAGKKGLIQTKITVEGSY